MRKRIGWGMAAMLLAALPGLAQQDWNQAYGSIGNNGFVEVETHIGVSPRWSVELEGPVEWGGPALDSKSGTIYLGTTNGVFSGFWRDGTLRCSVSFVGGVITSTPAVLPDGRVAVILQRFEGPDMQGFLALLTEDCQPRWTVELPRWSPDRNSVASGSVKVWASRTNQFLFLYGRGTRLADATNADLATWDEVLVYTTDGQLFARHPVGDACIEVGGGGWDNPLGDVWDFLSGFWPSVGTVPPLYEQLGWPDATPAIMDTPIDGVSSPSEPLVAVTGGCKAELEVLRFRPDVTTMAGRLIKTWSTSVDDKGTRLSSPAVTPEGHVAIGTSSRRLKVYNLPTHSSVWDVGTEEPVMHPPSMAPGVWLTVTDYKAWLFDPATGDEVPTVRPQPFRHDGSLGASAASLTQGSVPNFSGLEVLSYNLQIITHPLQGEKFRTSNPALSPDGRLYVVGQTEDDKAVLFAFGPP